MNQAIMVLINVDGHIAEAAEMFEGQFPSGIANSLYE